MPEEFPSFEHGFLEDDMKALAEEIERQKERPEMSGAGESEILKKATQALPLAARKKQEDKKRKSILPAYVQNTPPEVRLEVEYLLDIAFHRGIARAVKEANKSSDFIRDAFHDALEKILTPELKKRGIL